MRRPTFERWIRRYLLSLAGTESFSLRKLAAMAQTESPRLAEPLLLYACASGSVERLLGFVWRRELLDSYRSVLEAIGGRDLAGLALGSEIGGLPLEYRKFLDSYRIAYRKPESAGESKRLRWERSRMLQLEKGISTAQICRALALNVGNVNAYLKHGDVGKLSLKNATDIMKFLYEC
ncbi:MAG: hypothetical protein FWE65_02050 [Eggerthellaceae bacterium]|nr:hypothetical protein [Eggerthellaceae bacterium]